MRNRLALVLVTLALCIGPLWMGDGWSDDGSTDDGRPEERQTKDAVTGAVKCVQIRSIGTTDIIDDRTIVFHMRGRDVYLNRLPNRCPGLKIADAFGYETSLSVLCNVDIIRVLRNFGGRFHSGAGCGLGMFEPTTKEEIALLKERPVEPAEKAVAAEIEKSLGEEDRGEEDMGEESIGTPEAAAE